LGDIHPSNTTTLWLHRGLGVIAGIFFSVAFVISHTQPPLYTSNQNQYFLHGMANAGLGNLSEDWLANTKDPTPVFSFVVEKTIEFSSPFLFYVFYACLMVIYLWSIFGIVKDIRTHTVSKLHNFLFLSAIIILNSEGWRFALSRLLGPDWSYVFEDGFAGQRLLGPVFQPSTFGILLILSILLLIKQRPYLALISLGVAVNFHPTYLLTAAAIVISYIWVIFNENWKIDPKSAFIKSLLFGSVGLAIISPILIYSFINFGNSIALTANQARQILVEFRIPHHAIVSQWFDFTSVTKIVIFLSGLYVARRSKLFPFLLIPGLIAVLLTLVQMATNNSFLALLFPWRISTILIPLSAAVLLDHACSILFKFKFMQSTLAQRLLLALGLFAIFISTSVGIVRWKLDNDGQSTMPEAGLFEYIALNLEPGEQYLIPEKMQDFRLITLAPAFVDFKSIPYKDEDVLEWYRRIKLVEKFYKDPSCSMMKKLKDQEGISQIILNRDDSQIECSISHIIYADSDYVLLSLKE
jgi:hypothetical protein